MGPRNHGGGREDLRTRQALISAFGSSAQAAATSNTRQAGQLRVNGVKAVWLDHLNRPESLGHM
jgi:hypothetical protein